MSIRKNILANYISQIYVTVIGIVMLPVYLRYMGAEAFGLVGFFIMMNAWFQLLDMGLTPTLARETARFRGGATDAATLLGLLRSLEYIFFGVAVAGAAAIFMLSDRISTVWLGVQHLPLAEVTVAVVLMGLIVPVRWVSGLYRGAINGFERQIWLGGFNVLIATPRFVGVLLVFETMGATPTLFFSYQLVVALMEVAGLIFMTYFLMPRRAKGTPRFVSWGALRGVLGFSMTIAFTASVWVFVTQTDKLVLSKLLSLEEYGYFTLAVLVAGGVNVIGAPIAQALLPRLAKLAAEGNEAGVIALYRQTTQLVCVLAAPASMVLAAFAYPVLWAWTGDHHVASQAAPILSLYALGNGLLALSAFPYYLQYAKGNLRLHLIGHALLLVLLIPALLWATWQYGAWGAGCVWVTVNGLYFFGWTPLVHGHLAKGLHWQWLTRDIAPIALSVALAAFGLASIFSWPSGRMASAAMAVGIGSALLLLAIMASSVARDWLLIRLGVFQSKPASRA